MNKMKLEAPWETVKEKLQEINIELSDEDLAYDPHNEMKMLERVSKKTNKSVNETRLWIESVSFNRGKAG